MTISKASLDAKKQADEEKAQQELANFVNQLEAEHGQPVPLKSAPKGIDKAAMGANVSVPAPPAAKEPYSHQAMIQLMIEHPEYSHAQLSAHFGRHASFLSTVLASNDFQIALDPFRHLIADPSLTATLEERFRGLAIRSVSVLSERLNNANADPMLVLKSAEISVKALGAAALPPPAEPTGKDMRTPAQKILDAMDARDAADRARTLEMAPTREMKDVTPSTDSQS